MSGGNVHTAKAKRAAMLLLLPLMAFLLLSCPVKRSMLSTFVPVQNTFSFAAETNDFQSGQSILGENYRSGDKCVQTLKKETVVSPVQSLPNPVTVELISGLRFKRPPFGVKSPFQYFIPQVASPDGSLTYLRHQSFLIWYALCQSRKVTVILLENFKLKVLWISSFKK